MSERGSKDTPEQAEFRAHARQWLEQNRPGPPPFRLPQAAIEVMTDEQRIYLQDWQKRAYEAGLVGCDYPSAYGGGGRTRCQRVANQEMARAGVPYLINVIALGMAAPTLLHHGSEELKKRFIPGILSGETIWCQGFSEPGAGSDLASVRTSARRDGDRWILNGHKVWTSLAHFAEWMILLARHSTDDKYRGLTYFVAPIRDAIGKGVTVRPLIKITGETGFNEVLLEDLEIPDAYRLGEVGAGWTVAMTTLTHERGAGDLVAPSAGVGGRRATLDALVALARRTKRGAGSAADDPVIRDRIADLAIRERAIRHTFQRARVPALVDHPMRIPMQTKLVNTEHAQALARLGVEIAGPAASRYLADPEAPDGGEWPLAYMNSYGATIYAGTSEIQRNLLGERVLGLPKSK